MLKKTIKFEDYNGMMREEDHYFNLTKAELMEMEMGEVGGLSEKINRISQKLDVPEIMEIFKELILKSYGEKTPDGRGFMKKNGELAEAFAETEAYSELFMELVSDADKASEFINGILPKVEGAPNPQIPPQVGKH